MKGKIMMTPDNAAAIVATILQAETATSYTPTNPNFGIMVIPDETWLGKAYLEYVRIDGLATRGYAYSVELHTTQGTYEANEAGDAIERIAYRIQAAINTVIAA